MLDKTFEDHYDPGTNQHWRGRNDGVGSQRFHQCVIKVDLRLGLPKLFTKKSIALVGFASDEGVKRNQGRPGAVEGPASLRESLGKFPFNLGESTSLIDVGDIVCRNGDLEKAQEMLGEVVSLLIKEGIAPIVMGGGHEITWGSYKGITGAKPSGKLAIINFDAHYDLRPLADDLRGSSGTGFSQIHQNCIKNNIPFHYLCVGVQRYGNTKALFQRAEEIGVETIFAETFLQHGHDIALKAIDNIIGNYDHIYASLCLDVLNAACAPGVSAPQPLGIMPWHLLEPLRVLASSGRVACFDIAELSPVHDIHGMTSNLAATLICDYIHHHR